jgi:hypothetical protein
MGFVGAVWDLVKVGRAKVGGSIKGYDLVSSFSSSFLSLLSSLLRPILEAAYS